MCGWESLVPAAAEAEAGRIAGGHAEQQGENKFQAKGKKKKLTKDTLLLRDSGHFLAPSLEEVSSRVLRARPVLSSAERLCLLMTLLSKVLNKHTTINFSFTVK